MMKKNSLQFIPREFVFADIWRSDEIYTHLYLHQILDIFAQQDIFNYNFDASKNKIVLMKNFAVKIKTENFSSNHTFTLEFFRYYHRVYAVYVVSAVLLSFLVQFAFHGTKTGFFALVIFLLPIALIWMLFETIRGIKGIKEFDYSKKAEKFYFEILNAVKEKENRLNLEEETNNS